jgi:branched-chain amino acid transport system substrate-binding protein
MKKIFLPLLISLSLGVLIFLGLSVQASSTQTPQTIKIGAIVPYTGNAAGEGPPIERGINFALDEVKRRVAGKSITLKIEDETEDPSIAVAKAKKLVEQDKVDVIIGPLLAHTTVAVGAYLAPLGIPHFSSAPANVTESKDTFYSQGTARGDTYPSGLFAYDDLKARKAAIIYQDYLYGEQIRDGFKAAFTARGGTITSEQKVPLGTADMAPYIEGMGKPDVVCLLLVSPSDVGFMKQYRQAGLTMPAIFGQSFPQGEIYKLKEVGDIILGMYGVAAYSPWIDIPNNKRFVDKFQRKYGFQPGITTMLAGYLPTFIYLNALKSTGGDVSSAKIIQAINSIKDLQTPLGAFSMRNRIGIPDEYVFKAVKVGNDINWQVVKKYPSVQPR